MRWLAAVFLAIVGLCEVARAEPPARIEVRPSARRSGTVSRERPAAEPRRRALPAPHPRPAPSVTRAITLDPPEIVNRSRQLRFRDLTERPVADERVRSMAERRTTVEALRRSLQVQGR